LLRVRNFTQGEDEKIWINLLNQAFSDYEDRRLLTFDDMATLERSPRFDAAGMLIAEFNGKPAGCVDARVDKERKEKKGFIRDLGIIPEFRRKGIGRELLNKAIEGLVERGMEYAETYIDEDRQFVETLSSPQTSLQ
jgi:ribosomal protein S18 acetylase RimI-like enzyme